MEYQRPLPVAFTFTGRVTKLRRTHNSIGNPRYIVEITDAYGATHVTTTQPRSALGYAINNQEYADHAHVFSMSVHNIIVRTPTRVSARQTDIEGES